MVRIVQQARRDAGLDVSDRIRLTLGADAAAAAAIGTHAAFISAETLAVTLDVRPLADVDAALPHPAAPSRSAPPVEHRQLRRNGPWCALLPDAYARSRE